MTNSSNHVSCQQHLEVTYAFKKVKNSQLFKNLNDADIISMPMFATCKIKMEWVILFVRNCVFRRRVAKFWESFSWKQKLWFSLLSEVYKNIIIIITLMPMFAMYRPQVEYSILFVKIVNRYLEREQFFFSVSPVPKFWPPFCENQGRKNVVLVSLGEFFVHVTVTKFNVCIWVVKILFWLLFQACH